MFHGVSLSFLSRAPPVHPREAGGARIMTPRKLTKKTVDALRPTEQRYEVRDTSTPGFAVRVNPSGAKTFIYRYRIGGRGGRAQVFTIGKLSDTFRVGDARNIAKDCENEVRLGRDPQGKKRAERLMLAASDFSDLVDQFVDQYASKNRTAEETRRILTADAVSVWGKRSPHEITRADVAALIAKVSKRGSYAGRALHAQLRRLFAWSVETGRLEVSPMAGLKAPGKAVSRDRTLDDDEIVSVWQAAQEIGWPYGHIYQLLLLTGQRRAEVGRMSWDEINWDKKLWTIPRERAKNDSGHMVPLSEAALDVLRNAQAEPARLIDQEQRENGGKQVNAWTFVFTRDGVAAVDHFSKAKRRLDEKILELDEMALAPWRVHDLRRTVATGLARLGVSLPVIEKTLNHTSGSFSGIVSVYQKHEFLDERREALNKWAAHVASVLILDTVDSVADAAE